jgi:hypothetical protein
LQRIVDGICVAGDEVIERGIERYPGSFLGAMALARWGRWRTAEHPLKGGKPLRANSVGNSPLLTTIYRDLPDLTPLDE